MEKRRTSPERAKEAEMHQADLQKIIFDLDELIVGNLKDNGKQYISEDAKRYAGLSPSQALGEARRDLTKKKAMLKKSLEDTFAWDVTLQTYFYEALIALFEGVSKGRMSFPPLRNSQGEFVVERLGLTDWAEKVRRTNPK